MYLFQQKYHASRKLSLVKDMKKFKPVLFFRELYRFVWCIKCVFNPCLR